MLAERAQAARRAIQAQHEGAIEAARAAGAAGAPVQPATKEGKEVDTLVRELKILDGVEATHARQVVQAHQIVSMIDARLPALRRKLEQLAESDEMTPTQELSLFERVSVLTSRIAGTTEVLARTRRLLNDQPTHILGVQQSAPRSEGEALERIERNRSIVERYRAKHGLPPREIAAVPLPSGGYGVPGSAPAGDAADGDEAEDGEEVGEVEPVPDGLVHGSLADSGSLRDVRDGESPQRRAATVADAARAGSVGAERDGSLLGRHDEISTSLTHRSQHISGDSPPEPFPPRFRVVPAPWTPEQRRALWLRLLGYLPQAGAGPEPPPTTRQIRESLGIGSGTFGRETAALLRLGLLLRTGEGTGSSPYRWSRVGFQEPPLPVDPIARGKAKSKAYSQAQALALAEKRRLTILSLLPVGHDSKSPTVGDLSRAMGIHRSLIDRHLAKLISDGRIVRTGEGTGPTDPYRHHRPAEGEALPSKQDHEGAEESQGGAEEDGEG